MWPKNVTTGQDIYTELWKNVHQRGKSRAMGMSRFLGLAHAASSDNTKVNLYHLPCTIFLRCPSSTPEYHPEGLSAPFLMSNRLMELRIEFCISASSW